jgi:hypothetical protein
MVDLRVPVFLSWGRWVARCPRPGCHNAEQFGRCDDGTVGGLTGRGFVCRPSHNGCGLEAAADWPANLDDIEYMTRARPVAARNWFPGETVEDLMRENVTNGLIPRHDMDIIDGRLTVLREIEYPADHPAVDAGRF